MISDTPEERHARIMIECGCCIEDVALTFGWDLADAIHTISPALKANPQEAKRVRRLLSGYRLNAKVTHVIHTPTAQAKPSAALYSLHDGKVKRVA